MALKRKTLRVYLTPPTPEAEPLEHVVTITLADQLRGEFEAKKQGIPLDAPINLTTVFAWCAMTRLGLYTGQYQEFINGGCLDYHNEDTETDAVDPTQLAALDGLPLSSPAPTPAPAPPGGSTLHNSPTVTS